MLLKICHSEAPSFGARNLLLRRPEQQIPSGHRARWRTDKALKTLARALAVFLCLVSALVAQQPPQQSAAHTRRPLPLTAGAITNNVYRNPELGITYKFILGWVDRTDRIQDSSADSAKGQVLLAVFEHPPEVKAEGINSAVIIAAESLSAYPGVRTAADYFEPLTEAITSQGFKVVNEPYAATVGTKSLVRSDFNKEIGTLKMYQSSLVMLSKGYAISFTFIGSIEDEVERLIERLSFAGISGKQ